MTGNEDLLVMKEKSNEQLFLEAITELKNLAREQGNMLTNEQIDAFLADNNMEADKRPLLDEFLKNSNIGIDKRLDESEYLSSEEFDYLKVYMEELEVMPRFTDGEKRAIHMAALNGDEDAKNKVIEMFLPNVVEIAKLYANQGIMLADLIGEGNVALSIGASMLEGLEEPDEIDATLTKMVMEAMEMLIEEEAIAKKKDNKVLKLANKVEEASRELANEVGRKVTPKELADETGMSLSNINKAISISSQKMDYIEENTDAD